MKAKRLKATKHIFGTCCLISIKYSFTWSEWGFNPTPPPANRDCWEYVENLKSILIVKRIILKVINRLNKWCAYTIFAICQCSKICMDLNKKIKAVKAMIKNKVLFDRFCEKKPLVRPTKKCAERYSFLYHKF